MGMNSKESTQLTSAFYGIERQQLDQKPYGMTSVYYAKNSQLFRPITDDPSYPWPMLDCVVARKQSGLKEMLDPEPTTRPVAAA